MGCHQNDSLADGYRCRPDGEHDDGLLLYCRAEGQTAVLSKKGSGDAGGRQCLLQTKYSGNVQKGTACHRRKAVEMQAK